MSKMDLSIYLTAPLQLDRICRACLSEKGDMKPLFGACLDEMLLSFANIQVKCQHYQYYTCFSLTLFYARWLEKDRHLLIYRFILLQYLFNTFVKTINNLL